MEYRKLISFGKSSFVISLPKAWLQKNKLKKGQVIYVTEEGNNLSLSPHLDEEENGEQETILKTDNKTIPEIRREIVTTYIGKFGNLVLEGKDLRRKAKDIRAVLQNLMAFEIMEQTSNRIVAKDFLDIKSTSVNQMMKKMDFITNAILEDSINILNKESNKEAVENIFHRDEDVNRIGHLISKVIRKAFKNSNVSKTIKMGNIDLMTNWWVITSIEKISDESKRVAAMLYECKKKNLLSSKLKKEISDLYNEIKKQYNNMMKCYYTKDVDGSFNVASKKEELIGKCEKIINKESKIGPLTSVAEKLQTVVLLIQEISRAIYTE